MKTTEEQDVLQSIEEVIKSHITLIDEAQAANEENYLNSKMWIKQTFNNLFTLVPKEYLDQDVGAFLSISEQRELLDNPLSSIEFFKLKFMREIEEQEWEDELEQVNKTPPKRNIQPLRVVQSSNMGFRKKPALHKTSSKKPISAKIQHKFVKKV